MMTPPSAQRGAALDGRVVAITGAARGIGAATAAAFAAAGAKIAVCDIDVDTAKRTAAAIGVTAAPYHLDVTDPDAFRRTLDAVEDDLGPLAVLVNNAGIMPITAFADESVASIQRQLSTNVAGVIYGCQEGIRRMQPRRSGHIVNIASAAGKVGYPGVATYSATKFAVVGLTDTLALEYADTGIDFTCVMPGMVNTELTAGVSEHWLLRNVDPERIAGGIVDGVRRRRRHIHVPKRLGPINTLHAALPAAAGSRVMRLVGADHHILDGATNPARRDYEERAAKQSVLPES